MAERVATGWVVVIPGLNGGRQRFPARDLADVEPRALKLIWGYTGVDVDHVEIEVRLPPAIQDRLEVIRQLCSDIEAEYDAAVVEMSEMGLRLLDISRVLELHRQTPRPLTITNAEIAEHGLENHRYAVGVEWDDHCFALTRLCRRHVDSSRRTYRDLDPAGVSALVYTATGFVCDLCHEGDDVEKNAQ